MVEEQGPAIGLSGGARGVVRRLALFLVIAVAGLVAAHYSRLGDYVHVESVSALADRLGARGPVILVVAGLVTPLMFLPRWPIAFLAGLLYGIVPGTLLATTASAGGAYLHFLLSRTLLAPSTDRLRRRYGLDHLAIPRDKQFLVLFVLRAFPLTSFVATNLIAGALKLSRSRFLLGSFLGMIPSSMLYAAWGKLMKRPDPQFYAVAVAALALVVGGAVAAQRVVAPWFRAAEKGTAD